MEYNYITDMHVHTANIGTCATAQPEDCVEQYISRGVTSIVLASHITRSAMKHCGLEPEDWQGFCDCLVEEYERAVKAAAGRLHVIFGGELRIPNNNDYLLYGLTEKALRSWDGILKLNIKEASALVRESGCLIYQAHPFRDDQVITNPKYLDGIEVCNFNYKIDSRNDIARSWAEKYGLPGSCGSDFHHTDSALGGGILTEEPVKDALELAEVLRKQEYTILRYRDERSVWTAF